MFIGMLPVNAYARAFPVSGFYFAFLLFTEGRELRQRHSCGQTRSIRVIARSRNEAIVSVTPTLQHLPRTKP